MKIESITTKFGTAKIYNNRYYRITGGKEGNHGKYWHRLIWGDFYGCEVPEGYHIHHKNGNKLDNCILNLQLIHKSEHMSLHNKGKTGYWKCKKLSDTHKQKISESKTGKKHSEETKQKMSQSQNTSGYFRVHKTKDNTCKQGFIWSYFYYDEEGKKKKGLVLLILRS